MQVSNLEGDIKDGVMLINLIEILSGKPVTKKYKKNAGHRLLQLDNMKIVLETLESEGMKLVSMGKLYSYLLCCAYTHA